MEFNYERKLQELKKYVPFLENTIKRLENTHFPSFPRQAQVDKIRTLRDLLLDNRKRMTMDNLLKCERVLLNLYSNVKQRTSSTSVQRDTISELRTTNLSVARNKLQSVASKLHTSLDTLPEIARASKTEEAFGGNHFMEHYILGSKEPALFQQRPRKSSSTRSISPSRKMDFSSPSTSNGYMRENTDDKALFVRRSPKKSLRIVLPTYQSYQTKDYKKYAEDLNNSQLKDFNITLKVPEDSLHLLNTKDILYRIINCSDNDVDIDTLRGLRTQTVEKLKEIFSTKYDTSNIILKSYKNKVAKNKKSEDMEEGELWDSESEAIESIYGGLVIMNKDKFNIIVKPESLDKKKPYKDQICLVINPEKQEENASLEERKINVNFDISDFVSFENVDKENKTLENDRSTNTQTQQDLIKSNAISKETPEVVTTEIKLLRNEIVQTEINEQPIQVDSHTLSGINSISTDSTRFNSNKSVSEDVHSEEVQEENGKPLEQYKSSSETTHDYSNSFKDANNKHDVEISLLYSQKTQLNTTKKEISEIDILQALKNDILSETSNVFSSDIETPLFQPKLTKVANAEEIGYKKKISIEKYKAKATPKSVPNFGSKIGFKDDAVKKSLKLTEKECERFFLSNVSFDSFSDNADKSNSPDHDDFADTGLKPPIIPVDPVKMPVVISEKDIDMRKNLAQNAGKNVTSTPILPEMANVFSKEGKLLNKSELQMANLREPQMNREVTILNNQPNGVPVLRPNPCFKPVKPLIKNFAPNFNQSMPINIPGSNHNIISSLPPNITLSSSFIPNLPPNGIQNIGGSMTQNTQYNLISFDSTPSGNSFENEDVLNHNHVYTTMYQHLESKVCNEKPRNSRWSNDNKIPFWKHIDVPRNNQNNITIWENLVNQRNSSNTNWEDVGNSRKPSNMPSYNEYMATYYDRYNVKGRDPYIRDDCPVRRIDGPPATITSVSRFDCPPTPTPPFGRRLFTRNRGISSSYDHGYLNESNSCDKRKQLSHYYERSARRNNRDPRMCREPNEINNKFSDKKRNDSRDSKHCGIVNTSDNITKGIILGSEYGVKKYKIPKIRRNNEVSESIISDSIPGNEIKDNTENDCHKVTKTREVKMNSQTNLSQQNLTKDVKLSSGEQENTKDNHEPIIKPSDIECDSEKLSHNTQQLKEDKNIFEPQISIAHERRLTGSATKNASTEKILTDILTIQKTRNQKKTFVFESDSDENDIKKSIIKHNSTEKNNTHATVSEKADVKTSKMPLGVDYTDSFNDGQSGKRNVGEIEGQCLSGSSIQINQILHYNLKPACIPLDEKKKSEIGTSSFGIYDLEIFPDNVISDPVKDNINELIADLGDNLDAAKNQELANTDFTKDMSFGTVSENTSTPCKDRINLSICENEIVQDKNAMATAVVIDDKDTFHKISSNINTLDTSLVITRNEKEIRCSKEDKQESDLEVFSSQEGLCLDEMLFKKSNEKKIPQKEMIKCDEFKNQGFISTTYNQPHAVTNLGHSSEVCKKFTVDGDSLKTPDSTIKHCVTLKTKLDGNCPDTTKKPIKDMMNYDISTGLNNFNKTEIEYFGKFLSILKDKIKTRELFALLGDQSSECERLKKKLEKLSELGSDDEEIANEDTKRSKEMFISDDVLNSTEIRMGHIAKLFDEKSNKNQDTTSLGKAESVVVLKKMKDITSCEEDTASSERTKKGKGKKTAENEIINKTSQTSQTKPKESNIDPYDFETDSIKGTNIPSFEKDISGMDVEFLESSKTFGSNQLLTEIKKTKRRRRNGCISGLIKSKCRKKLVNQKQNEIAPEKEFETPIVDITIPDMNCYIDKMYCFRKKYTTYECRLCVYKCHKIVNHYKKHHPGSEIPCSRMSPFVAKSAIKESEEVNIQAISKITPKKYVCRFCFKEFLRNKPLIESFFWHIVSVHTGEYKRPCLEGAFVNDRQFDLDIPPHPTETKGQLLGYICGKCNYTQISIENLKSHIILRHDDEPTAVYNISLAALTRPYTNILLKQVEIRKKIVKKRKESSRVLRSSRFNPRFTETIDLESNSMVECSQNLNESLLCNKRNDSNENTNTNKNIQSEIAIEIDSMDNMSDDKDYPILQIESDTNNTSGIESEKDGSLIIEPVLNSIDKIPENDVNNENKDLSDCPKDVLDCPHFKIKYNKSGSKEYICCIKGHEHYRTRFLFSFKKHVEFKHSEKWDGFCYVCKVIVTPQGTQFVTGCLSHFLDKHVDNFPILEETAEEASNIEPPIVTENQTLLVNQGPTPVINVRPISELVSDSDKDNAVVSDISKTSVSPITEKVISLGSSMESPRPSSSYQRTSNNSVPFEKLFKYEKVPAEMMSKKHRVVLDVMMSENKLGHVFKCSGRFCSFTTDSTEDALLHASIHARLGGEDALNCVYCDFDCHQNSIVLVTHVFNNHGNCQYICGKCFYRAAASQLVEAHFKRVHDASTSVTILRTATQITCDEEIILAREVAVPHYVCSAEDDSEGTCGFKTYSLGKFCEHLGIRHSLDSDYKCFICTTKVAAPADLVCHLKSHDLNLYQCCWCVHGADNKTELLAHASAYHPTKVPKAYLRIITNKKGLSDLRVLPLANLTKSNVGAKDIIMSTVIDNPEKEAELSLELEKLLKQNSIKTKIVSSEETYTQQEDLNSSFDIKAEIKSLGSSNASSLTTMQPELTPISVPNDSHSTNEQETSNTLELLNSEKTVEIEPVRKCLDSDEDNSIQGSIESNNSTSSKEKKVLLKNLFLCPKCKTFLNTGIEMKRHIMFCYVSIPDPISCAHCSVTLNKREIVNHYYEVHSLEGKPGRRVCSKCHLEFKSVYLLKEHRKLEHSNTVNKTTGGTLSTSVKEVKTQNRRKRSLGSKEKSETIKKIRRYGPQDVNLLPINPILDDLVFCSLCEFKTKVKLNMVRHLQLHAEQQPVPQTAPVNPVPHLETNEKHFDKMVNLASSSIVTRTPDKKKTENTTAPLPPDAESRFPKYVPEKHRLTCGAKGCFYISIDESMLKSHWETLHDGSNEFYCVHCPPQQYLDVSQPLTSCRIIAHLKMHDSQLYACSLCTYYNHNREVVQKHLVDTHKGGQVMVVREEVVTTSTTNQVQNTTPTMDLKPWQCGLCSFKSLLRPEVVDHCAKEHNSNMQYKCAYCAFRTSNVENITKHHSKSHPDQAEEIFYYYYREGSVPDDPDGTQKWQKQGQKNDIIVPQLKSEPTNDAIPPLQPLLKPIISSLNLDLVKKELIEPIEDKLEDLCNEFGEFCDPNGLKYKCPLCTNEMEEDLETIQSHLFEELKYKKWGCSICSYKAFHKAGLSEHMQVEHCQNREPIALEIDYRVETWVNKLLEYQTSLIEKYKDNLLKQKPEIFRATPENSKVNMQQTELRQTTTKSNSSSISLDELNKIFGTFGASVNSSYCCPKCNATFKDEDLMQNHLEIELNKIRWFCSTCYMTFQTFHEAQFHCQSTHSSDQPAARPSEAPRNPSARDAWVRTVLTVQRLSIADEPKTEPDPKKDSSIDESLLVVRYEEIIPTPDIDLPQPPIPTDSYEEKLVSDEPLEKKEKKIPTYQKCTFCGDLLPRRQQMHGHILKHYNLKPFVCGYCSFNGTKPIVVNHHKRMHVPKPLLVMPTPIPNIPPLEYAKKHTSNVNIVTCLVCKKTVIESEVKDHLHPDEVVSFARKGDTVIKCSVCSKLSKNLQLHLVHHQKHHPKMENIFIATKLDPDEEKEKPYYCNKCKKTFLLLEELRAHLKTRCCGTSKMTVVSIKKMKTDVGNKVSQKRKNEDNSMDAKMKIAKKTKTTAQNIAMARKSTTRLPSDTETKGEASSSNGKGT